MSKLLDQVRASVRLKHFSIRTEQACLHWIKRFIIFHGKHHPSELNEQHVTAFLSRLAVDREVAVATQNQALSAVVFLYWQSWHSRLLLFLDVFFVRSYQSRDDGY